MRTPLLAVAISAAAMVAARLPVARAQPAPPAADSTPAAPSESTELTIQRDLNQQAAILTGAQSTPEQREQAAERLVLRQSAAAREILLKALNETGNRPAQIAVAKALAGNAQSDPRLIEPFIQPLLDLLGRDLSATTAAVAALSNFGDNAPILSGLIAFAGNRSQALKSRVEVIGGIGAFVKKNAAAFLIGLMNERDEDPRLRSASTEALLKMTRLQQYGGDVEQWNRWWSANANLPDSEWEAAQYHNLVVHYAQVNRELQRLADHLKEVLENEYKRASKDQRTDILLDWLKDTEPPIRAFAAKKVNDEKLNAKPIAVAIVEQLRGMIGDSSVDVRKAVIEALRNINDAASLDPLLAQLALETDPDVKIAIAKVLAVLKQPKSIDPLLELLKGPSTRVAEAAADALRLMGDVVREDPALSSKVSINLRVKLEAIGTEPGSESLRGYILEAMAQLRDPSLLRVFSAALDATNPDTTTPKIRIAACRGLGSMLNPRDRDQATTDLINTLRRDPDRGVRLEAAKAIGNVATFARAAEALHQQTMTSETDPDVRDAAWSALEKMFSQPEATADILLGTWLDRFKSDSKADPRKLAVVLQKRLVVLQAARDKLIKDAGADPRAARTLAGVHQNIGEAQTILEQWDRAAASFRASLAYWQIHNGAPATVAQLSQQLMKALLRAGSYSEAVQFARERIATDPQAQSDMGYQIRSEVGRLKDSTKAEDWRNAAQLIDETEKMKPPLEEPYAEPLKKDREELRRRLAAQGNGAQT